MSVHREIFAVNFKKSERVSVKWTAKSESRNVSPTRNELNMGIKILEDIEER